MASWPFEQRLGATMERAKLAPEVRAQLQGLVSGESLAIMAGVVVAWLVSHAFGLGEIIDIILGVAGAIAIGYSVFSGLDHLYLFAEGAYNAKTGPDLDEAADHFAKAVGILGVQAVLSVLFRGRPYGGRATPSPPRPPPPTPGKSYRPTITWTATMRASEGETTSWGDIRVSSLGTRDDQLVALYHEKVHQWFTPKLYLMRNFRVECATGSYVNSSLWRYIEEGLAEGIAQTRVYGFQKLFVGFSFPVKNGYLFLIRSGANPAAFRGLAGGGLFPELAGLLASGLVLDVPIELRHNPNAPPP